MDALALFLHFHQNLPKRAIPRLFERLSEQQMRTRPHPAVNSIAWLIWHMARVEDAGISRLVAAQPQLFEEEAWGDRLGVPFRHHGTGMTTQEVTELSQTLDLAALRAYYDAVNARTVEVVQTLSSTQLDTPNDFTYLRQVLFEEGMLHPNVAWKPPFPYQDQPRGTLLFHFGVTHNYGHCYEACTVCSLLGVPFW
jgi:uncharacterized damage-inducible protein DinB